MQVILSEQHRVPFALLIGNIRLSIGSGILNCKNGIEEQLYFIFIGDCIFLTDGETGVRRDFKQPLSLDLAQTSHII